MIDITLIILVSVLAVILLMGYSSHRSQSRQHALRQTSGLEQACELLALMKTVQQHRGVSSGILGGKTDQMSKLHQLAGSANQQMQKLAKHLPEESKSNWQGISQKWQHIETHWKSSDVLDNFEEHCDLLQDIHDLILDITDYSALTSSHRGEEKLLAGEIFGHLPAMIENIGQLRALSTHAAASHDCITAFRLHLQFLMEQLGQQNRHARQHNMGTKTMNDEIDKLIALVKQEVLDAERITVDPDTLFQRATQVMDNGFQAIDKGINHFRQAQIS